METRGLDADYWRSTGRLQSIDVLRGAAAFAVVLAHIKHFRPHAPMGLRFWLLLPLEFGAMGVPLFVVLSGFCIHLGVAKQIARTGAVEADWLSFWKRRFHRLYPPYVAAIVLGLLSYGLARPDLENTYQAIVNLPADIATHVLLLANLFQDDWAGVGNFPLWTLCMEEQLYLLYAGYIALRRVIGVRVWLVALVVTVSWKIARHTLLPTVIGRSPFELGQWDKWPFDFWFNWVIGAIAAESYAGAIVLPEWCYRRAWLCVALGVGIVTNPILMGRLAGSSFLARQAHGAALARSLSLATLAATPAIAVTFFILINRWIRLELHNKFGNRITRLAAGIGLFSYSLYLIHIPLINSFESTVRLGDGPIALFIRYATIPATSLIVAYLFYRIVESKFLNSTLSKSNDGDARHRSARSSSKTERSERPS